MSQNWVIRQHEQNPVLQTIATFSLVFVVAFVLLSLIQFASPNLVGVDGYYHIKVAQLLVTHGIPTPFPNLPFTIINQDDYFDMHMLFHVFQAPFTMLFDDLRLAAKVSVVFYAALTFTTMGWVLHRCGVRYPIIWVLLLFAVSSGFLHRMEMPRTQVFGLLFMVIASHFILRKKMLWLAITTVLFVLTYKAFTILIPMAAIGFMVHLICDRKIELRLGHAIFCGIALGLLLNPYFPNNVNFILDEILSKILSADYEIGVGNEWYPYDTWELMQKTGFGLALFLFGAAITHRQTWLQDKDVLYWFILTLLWLFMLTKSNRFTEYFSPSAVMFFALAVKNDVHHKVTAFKNWKIWSLQKKLISGSAAVLCVVLVLGAIMRNIDETNAHNERSWGPINTWRGGATWLKANTAPGSTIFHTGWDMFPMLYYYNSENNYIVGLDPDYLRKKNRQVFDVWWDYSYDTNYDSPRKLVETFGAQYAISKNDWGYFIEMAENSHEMKRVFRDKYTSIYRIELDDE